MHLKGIFLTVLSTWEWTNMFVLCKRMFVIIAIQTYDNYMLIFPARKM